jgi:hypothetical protein
MAYRNYSVANGLTVDPLGNGDFTTISAALTSAVSGQTIFVRPGTYTGNLTLKAGVNICAFVTDSDIPNVIINGTCTFTGAGTVGISGAELQTNSAFALTVSGSAASIVYLNDCFINALNNTAIDFTSSSPSAAIYVIDCTANIATTGIGLFTHSSAGILNLFYANVQNSGSTLTSSTCSAGNLILEFTYFAAPITTSGTGAAQFIQSWINCTATNTTALTLTTSAISSERYSSFSSGSASAISIGSTASFQTDFMAVQSGNTNAITGAGAIQYGLIVYDGTSSGNNVTTQTTFNTQPALSTTGSIVQQIRKTSTTAISTTTTLALTGTIPTTSNTTLAISQSVTPKSATDVLIFDFACPFSGSAVAFSGCSFFLFAGTTLLGSFPFVVDVTAGTNNFGVGTFRFYAVSGTTSATTYAVYYAPVSGTAFLLTDAGTAYFGGTGNTSMQLIVTEVLP